MEKYTYNSNLYRITIVLMDFLLIHFACKLGFFLRHGDLVYPEHYPYFVLVFGFAWIGVSLYNNIYRLEDLFKPKVVLRQLLWTFIIHGAIISILMVSVKMHYISRVFLFYSYAISLSSVLFTRLLLLFIYKYHQQNIADEHKIVIVGTGNSANLLGDFLKQRLKHVHHFMGLEDVNNPVSKREVAEKVDELKNFCIKQEIDEIYYAMPLNNEELLDEISAFADNNFIYFRIVSDVNFLKKHELNVDVFGDIPVISLRKDPQRFLVNRIVKRIFDIVFSLGVITLVMPIAYFFIGLAIKLESKGPIFFKQSRSGRKNRIFECYKFRTMRVNDESDSRQATKGDNRITKVGSFLRRSNLDELPQFFNVFMGHMSVVGPRPHMLKHTQEYSEKIDGFLVRHFIIPGITGHAQVNGFRGSTEDPEMMKKRVEFDTWYVENWSFFLDLKIIFLTVWRMIKGQENAY